MASSIGSKVALLIVGGGVLLNTTLDTIDRIKSIEGPDAPNTTIALGHIYMTATEVARPTIFIGTMSGITLNGTGGNIVFGSGDLVFTSARNAQPCLVDGSKSFHCTDRGAMSAPTANTNHYVASVANPFTASNGTGVVMGAASLIACEGVPNEMSADLTVSTSATASGSITVRNEVLLYTGARIIVNTGSVIEVPTSSFLTLVTASGSDVTRQSPDCDLVPYWVEV